MYPKDLIDLAELYKTKKSTASLAKWKPPIFLKLVEYTNFLPNTATCKQRLYHVEQNLFEVPKCSVCGSNVKWIQTYKPAQYSKFCSSKCGNSSNLTKEKRKQTCLEKYGVDSFSKTEQHIQHIKNITPAVWEKANKKREQTCVEKYGVSHTTKVEKFNEKRKKTTLERYGHTNILASDVVKKIKLEKYGTVGYTSSEEFLEKRKNTMLEKYGVEYSGQNKELLQKRYDTCVEKYGTPFVKNSHINIRTLNKLGDINWLFTQHKVKEHTLSFIAEELNVDLGTVRRRFQKYNIDVVRFNKSVAEQEISSFLTDHNIKHETNNRTILNGRELDIVIRDLKIAIEYCGLYWHSTAHSRNTQHYHSNKRKSCQEKGYRLITIFEDEWINKKELVKQKLANILHIQTTERIFARKCLVIEISHQQKQQFFERHHIQGSGPGSLSYALVYKDEIVACMTYIRKKDNRFVLNRYATSQSVIGGFSKLLSYFKKNNEWKEIVSFADLRWSDGNVYETNGFNLDKVLHPDYEYVDLRNIKRIHKFNFRHKHLRSILGETYNPSLSETQNTRNHNWFRIYNCGLLRYVVRN